MFDKNEENRQVMVEHLIKYEIGGYTDYSRHELEEQLYGWFKEGLPKMQDLTWDEIVSQVGDIIDTICSGEFSQEYEIDNYIEEVLKEIKALV